MNNFVDSVVKEYKEKWDREERIAKQQQALKKAEEEWQLSLRKKDQPGFTLENSPQPSRPVELGFDQTMKPEELLEEKLSNSLFQVKRSLKSLTKIVGEVEDFRNLESISNLMESIEVLCQQLKEKIRRD